MRIIKRTTLYLCVCTFLFLIFPLSSFPAEGNEKQKKDTIKILKEYEAKIHPTLPPFKFQIYFDGTCPGIYVTRKDKPKSIQNLFCPEMDNKFELEIVDINFDGYKDIMLLSFDAHNRIYTYWVFDKSTGRFKFENGDRDEENYLENPVIDAKQKKLITEEHGLSGSTTSTFKYRGGKRILVKEEDVETLTSPDGVFQGMRRTVKILKKGKMVVITDQIKKNEE